MTPVERYSVHYRISGPSMDVDALLAVARPSARYEVWRRGDVLDEGKQARTAGIQIEIVDHHEEADVVEAIDAFLDIESSFLAAVRRIASDETPSVLACALWVYADEPVGLTLPVETMRALAKADITLEVSGYPRIDD